MMIDNSVRILNDMLLCSADCAGDFAPESKRILYEEELIDWLYHNLPALPYVIDQTINYVFSNGLTTGDEAQDEKLDAFMYAPNIQGVTNHAVIRESVKLSLIYGKQGLRWLSQTDGIIGVESKRYGALVDQNEEYYGFDDVVGYLVSMDDVKIWDTKEDEINFDREVFERQGILIDKDNRLLLIGKGDFLSLRNNPMTEDGESPLKYDLQRTKLLATIYERLNYDIEYDGPGRILLRLKDGWDNGGEDEVSTTKIIDASTKAQTERRTRAKKEAAQLGKEIKESGSDSVIIVSNIFDKDIEHLPRTTMATDFKDVALSAGEIVSQVFGMPPTLLGLGKISGNVSMEKIIDNAMLNAVIPMRERFATQLSGFLAPLIGVDKIYFNKYEMQQVSNENDQRTKVVGMVEKLRKTGKDVDGKTADRLIELLNENLENKKL